jgi:putative DNA primase/helicase
MMHVSTKERARGHWRGILPRLGIDQQYLAGRNCPCPVCGGTDRFRYLDRRGQDGDGMWICNQCTPHPRPAIDLVIAFTGLPFKDAAREVDIILDGGNVVRRVPVRPIEDTDPVRASAFAKKVWARGVRVQRGDVVDRWLHSRGVGMDLYPPCLRTSPRDWYRDDETDAISRYPAMLAMICGADGKPVAVHRTYLAANGTSKAPVDRPRKVAGRFGPNPTIRLAPPGPILGIAEGVETALSASRLFGIPTWSVLSTYGIETFEPPAGLQRLIVFADHDANGAGQKAAHKLAAQLVGQIPSEIRFPDTPGDDWNDVLRRR